MRRFSRLLILVLSLTIAIPFLLVACSSGGASSTTPVTVTATTTVAQTATVTAPAPSGQPIKIGLILDYSGPFSGNIHFMAVPVRMAINAINASGGLLGRPVTLIEKDDRLDPAVVPQRADELKAAGVAGIIGASSDSTFAALATWAGANKIPIAGGTSADLSVRTTAFNRYLFFTSPVGWVYGNVLAQQVAKMDNIKTIYTIATDVGANHVAYDAFWSIIPTLKPGIQNIGNVYTSMTEQDFTSVISAGVAKKPDMLFDLCAGPSGSAFIQQALQFDTFNKTKVMGLYLLGADITTPFKDKYPVGVDAIDLCPYWLDTPPMKAFLDEFYKQEHLYPGSLSIALYNSAISMIAAIQKANSTDPDAMIKAWETMSVDTPSGKMTFNPYDHQGDLPLFYCTSGYLPNFPLAVGVKNVTYQQGVYPTEAQINTWKQQK